ncbi:hypothetical protein F8O01_09885 [Pseudoclavibacter chungangensis]|uniref:Roadblock/LC7 domain-containing protein n=1 Tax=Pseudoclavibacter chungangensis TaxID=587635 RepID=A0A7J5BQV0_9MICO|nr:hypothetical protein [Pseudoclavibacter chungangensis]KAB1656688.1 hypothetical protein F8O01_09885 [Pseudoclavibacter chungangensis]NYJ67857.1 hypothetical protein [Pseudoclavibacter chungangensis]
MSQLDQQAQQLLSIEGATGAAVVDIASGMALATAGTPGFDLTVAAAGNANVIRAKLKTMSELGLQSTLEDIMITIDGQYHLINALSGDGKNGLFIYLVLDQRIANLALARHKVKGIAASITV